jgi:hypothetical protein
MQERKKDRTKEHIEIRAREAQIQNIQNANVDANYHTELAGGTSHPPERYVKKLLLLSKCVG